METKVCTKCKKELPVTREYFSFDKSRKKGFHSQCKKCKRNYQRKYRQTKKGQYANRETRRKYKNTIRGYLQCLFSSINQRCSGKSKNPKHRTYVKKNIKNRFISSDEFVNYVINELQIDPRGLQIDRIDNNGDYEKNNIRFVTARINANNRKFRSKLK